MLIILDISLVCFHVCYKKFIFNVLENVKSNKYQIIMITKKRKTSDEDDQEYFIEEDNNKHDDKISFAKVGCLRLNPGVRGELSPLSFHG